MQDWTEIQGLGKKLSIIFSAAPIESHYLCAAQVNERACAFALWLIEAHLNNQWIASESAEWIIEDIVPDVVLVGLS